MWSKQQVYHPDKIQCTMNVQRLMAHSFHVKNKEITYKTNTGNCCLLHFQLPYNKIPHYKNRPGFFTIRYYWGSMTLRKNSTTPQATSCLIRPLHVQGHNLWLFLSGQCKAPSLFLSLFLSFSVHQHIMVSGCLVPSDIWVTWLMLWRHVTSHYDVR